MYLYIVFLDRSSYHVMMKIKYFNVAYLINCALFFSIQVNVIYYIDVHSHSIFYDIFEIASVYYGKSGQVANSLCLYYY